MVPGSTLMYGSSLMRVTLRPRDSRIAARDAEAMPLPREDTTPPVTNTNLVMSRASQSLAGGGNGDYRGRASVGRAVLLLPLQVACQRLARTRSKKLRSSLPFPPTT